MSVSIELVSRVAMHIGQDISLLRHVLTRALMPYRCLDYKLQIYFSRRL